MKEENFKIFETTLVKYLGKDKNVEIPEGITTIGKKAFSYNDKVESVKMPSTLVKIDTAAFDNCINLKKVNLNDGLEEIGLEAFIDCGLIEIEIPKTVKKINSSFFNCYSLKKITVDKNNKKFDSRYNCNAIIETKKEKIIVGCCNTIIDDDIQIIGKNAFIRCIDLKKLDTKNIVEIEKQGFMNCSGLESITFGKKIEIIGQSAFEGCSNLVEVKIPKTVKQVGPYAFTGCKNYIDDIFCVFKIECSKNALDSKAFSHLNKEQIVASKDILKHIGF